MYYTKEMERLTELFRSSSFITCIVQKLQEGGPLYAKFCHVKSVTELMVSAARNSEFTEKETLMSFAAALFHDIACFNDLALTGNKYGPNHGARGADITFSLLTQRYDGFSKDEIKAITTAIANHDGATTENLKGFTKTLTFLLRDCDKVDCYRRQSTEPLGDVFQRPLQFNSPVRPDFAARCLNGEPIKYAEMQNFNEECLLYLGWFFQLNSHSSQEAALPLFLALAERLVNVTCDLEAKRYMRQAVEKAKSIVH